MIKSLKHSIALRLIFLIITILTGFIAYYEYNLILAPILIFVITILQTFTLFNLLNRTNKSLKRFFESIKFNDMSISLGKDVNNKYYKQLLGALEEIRANYKKEREESEKSSQLIKFIIINLDLAVLLISSTKNEVLFSNSEAYNIFNFSNNNLGESSNNKELAYTILKSRNNSSFEFKVNYNNKPSNYLISIKEIRFAEDNYQLVLLNNLSDKFEEKELDAWESLIRVLTHEIMNSMTPIQSLADTIKDICNDLTMSQQDKIDVSDALNTIKSRSINLQQFVESYRSMTLLPKPILREININNLFNNISNLFKQQFNDLSIAFKIEIHNVNYIYADENMIEQVLVNLILNAIDAVSHTNKKEIELAAEYNDLKQTIISVKDSGYGVEPDNLEKIFVPFFTTKRKGSGIGLNLCKQIISLHHGSIIAKSEINKGTEIIITF